MARRLLAEFRANRPEDLVGMVLFSASPIPVLSFTQKQDMIQAAIAAGGVGRGLSETDIGRGLLAAADYFDQRAYTGSRLILMVSDGGAQLEPEMRERLTTLLKRHRIALYWIYIRSAGSRGLQAQAGDSEAMETAPERSLHRFFQSIGMPYRAYEAEDPEALQRAIADVGANGKPADPVSGDAAALRFRAALLRGGGGRLPAAVRRCHAARQALAMNRRMRRVLGTAAVRLAGATGYRRLPAGHGAHAESRDCRRRTDLARRTPSIRGVRRRRAHWRLGRLSASAHPLQATRRRTRPPRCRRRRATTAPTCTCARRFACASRAMRQE